ncbi:hypothetical protein ACFY3G_38110 [Streptomyces phaeochromogenes]|uniref:hypothetical protein n=1 Tax=Streptomyces phaeochromogenes TaxID=1923 RepID=UPI003681EC61
MKAAGVARVNLVCAASTWEELRWRCSSRYGNVHFPQEAEASASDGLTHVELEGPHLARLTQRVFRGSMPWSLEGSAGRALCRRTYDAVAEVVDEIDLAAVQGKPVRDIVLDARIGPA